MGIFDTAQTERTQSAAANNAAIAQTTNQQPAANGGIFDRIGKADVSRTGVYPVAGVYPVLYVDVVKMFRSRKSDDLFTAEFLILESQVIDRPAGSKMTWQTNMKHDAGPGNARGFIAAVMSCKIDEVTAQAATLTCSAENPCHGRLVRLLATQIETRAGNPFTVCDWVSLPEDQQVQAEAARISIFGE